MNIAAVFIAYFGIKETQFHPTLVREEDNSVMELHWQRYVLYWLAYFCYQFGHSG